MTTWRKWHHSGYWDRLMGALEGMAGRPVCEPTRLPVLRGGGTIDPRLFIVSDKHPPEDGSTVSVWQSPPTQ
jgi:hypothetical protein